VNTLPSWLYTGGPELCQVGTEKRAVVHATNGPCYLRARGPLPPGCDCLYRGVESPFTLYLDLSDPPVELADRSIAKLFFEFAEWYQSQGIELAIHCRSGRSTAPALAMLLLARMGLIPNSDASAAQSAFAPLYPQFEPESTVWRYVSEWWPDLMLPLAPAPS
jgi:hypothetical protein